ncbi:MAG: hypothetical protein FJY75_02940 [Candidatus Eisenbacteria bacterium]|uniref:Uncharacterized protein n=1 Tax=Eiseniibacteriota bacterium TaxID=2212470 RepID=A0A938BQ55_UNCEI|nr:hypothetical protein [Candidatus Eisenbacteria bacterium]
MNWERLLKIDRRVIFLTMALAIILPLLFPIRLTMGVQRVTRNLFQAVEAIDPARQCLLISTDYTPQTEPENHPMAKALMRHGFARRVPVLVNALYVEGAPLIDQAITEVMGDFNARATSREDSILYGRDIVYLGWQPPPIVPILAMGESITGIYPDDYYGNRTDSLEVMRRIRNYADVGIVVAITPLSSPLWYVQFAQTKYGVKVGAGCTAVCAPDFYPYCATGQLSGMMAGMKGAAEYEELVEQKYRTGGRLKATEGMASQSAAHVLIMVFVILGNVAYFAMRRKS